jgi:hypothetical protein
MKTIKPTKGELKFLIIWCSIHLFALLMSYSGIEIFSDTKHPRSDKFWPFVEFVYKESHIDPSRWDEFQKRASSGGSANTPVGDLTNINNNYQNPANNNENIDSLIKGATTNSKTTYSSANTPVSDLTIEETHFNGIFYEYDWTEFAVYVGGALILYLLVKISNNNEESQMQ